MRTHLVNRAVRGQKNPDDRAPHATIRVLRKRCLRPMRFTLSTSCPGTLCSPFVSRYEIAVSEMLTKFPECFFEVIPTT